MITDDELIRLLELADPARVADPAPVLEPAEYRGALLTSWTPVTLVDREPTPTQPTSGRRWAILIAAAAAVVLVGVLVGVLVVYNGDDVTPADEPSPTVTVTPTPPPRALPNTPGKRFVPGTYFVDEVDGTPTARIFFTIGAGWTNLSGGGSGIWQPNIGYITFSRPDRVFSDACDPSDGYHPGPVATLDGLVAALTEQQGWADVTAPSDISIDGYAGKAFQRAESSDCEPRGWENGTFYETLWVLDIDGTVVVINTRLLPTGTSARGPLDLPPSSAARAEFAAVLDSIRIERT